MLKTTHIGLLAVAVLLVGIAGWGIRFRLVSHDDIPTVSTPLPAATTTEQGKVHVDPSGVQIKYGFAPARDSATPTTVLSKGIPAPDLNRSVVIPPRFAQDIAASATADIQGITAALRENPANAALWGTLGLKRHGIEDYEGARQAYEYSLVLSPNNGVTAENLAVLYGYYLHEPQKAEKYFLQALDIETLDYRYLRLYELYKDIMKDTAKARAILEQGLQKHPGNTSFRALLESL